MKFIQTAPAFQAQINAIAGVANMSVEQVYELWRKYDKQCTAYDQSPVMSEFIQWYASDMGSDRLTLQKALDDEKEFQENQADLEAAYEESVAASYRTRGRECLY